MVLGLHPSILWWASGHPQTLHKEHLMNSTSIYWVSNMYQSWCGDTAVSSVVVNPALRSWQPSEGSGLNQGWTYLFSECQFCCSQGHSLFSFPCPVCLRDNCYHQPYPTSCAVSAQQMQCCSDGAYQTAPRLIVHLSNMWRTMRRLPPAEDAEATGAISHCGTHVVDILQLHQVMMTIVKRKNKLRYADIE